MKRIAAFGWPLAGALVLMLETAIRVALGAPPDAASYLWGLVGWLEWTLLAPMVVFLAERFPYRRGGRRAFFLVHGFGPFVFSFVHSAIFFALRILFTGDAGAPGVSLLETWSTRWPSHLTLDFLVYTATVLAVQVVLFLRNAWSREQERFALERRIAQAELDLFRFQLDPRFVDQQLEAIEESIERDPAAAESLIVRFSALLRQRLAAATAQHDAAEDDDPIARDEDEVESGAPPKPLSLPLRFVIGVTAVPGMLLMFNSFSAIRALTQNQPIPWGEFWRSIELSWFAWPLTLFMMWLGSRVKRIATLAFAAAAAPLVWDFGSRILLYDFAATRKFLLDGNRTTDFLFFFAIALAALAYQRHLAWRRHAVEVAQLDSVLLRTRAYLLRLQLNPHFLFNALNSVAALLEDDPAGARRMAARVRHFVALVLATSDRQEVPLGEELDLLATYFAIETVRFGEKVRLDVHVGRDASTALVPSLLLQPLVENALRHGLQPATGGRVSVTAEIDRDALLVEVLDNGRARNTVVREGIGLSNTRARLRQLYGDGFAFEVDRHDSGFRARLTIPFRTAPLAANPRPSFA